MKQEQSKTAAGGQRSVSYGELAELQQMFREPDADFEPTPLGQIQELAEFCSELYDGDDSQE